MKHDPQDRWWKGITLPDGLAVQQVQINSLGYGRPFVRIHGIVVDGACSNLTISNGGISPVIGLNPAIGVLYPCNFIMEPGAIVSAFIPGAVPATVRISLLCERLTALDTCDL